MIIKNILNKIDVLEYLVFTLDGTNGLSSELTRSKCFDYGRFFTLLPENIAQTNIYKFRTGGLAKGVRALTAKMVTDFLKDNVMYSCIFDDCTSTAPIENYELYEKYGKEHLSEAYYVLVHNDVSLELIEKCFRASNGTWHSLCVIFNSLDQRDFGKVLTDEAIRHICDNAQLILIGAYDGEGYVFWERNVSNLFGQYVQSQSVAT